MKTPTIVVTSDSYCLHLEANIDGEYQAEPELQSHMYRLQYSNGIDLTFGYEEIIRELMFTKDYQVIREATFREFRQGSLFAYSRFITWAYSFNASYDSWMALVQEYESSLGSTQICLLEPDKIFPDWLKDIKDEVEKNSILYDAPISTASVIKAQETQTKQYIQEFYNREQRRKFISNLS